ncbi:MAG: S8 family serine peptidase [Firmicutes bacterium]|nr:S8 family serine peptidase [Bacillota bacterium]
MKTKLGYGVLILCLLGFIFYLLHQKSMLTSMPKNTAINKKLYYLEKIEYESSKNFINTDNLKNIKIAIVDSGIDLQCTDLPINNIEQKYIFPASYSQNKEHATQICSIISGNQGNNENIIGLAPGVKIYSYVVTDGVVAVQIGDIVRAIELAINDKVDVINLSLGSYEYSSEEEKVIKKALANNIVIIASFGSRGDSKGLYPAILDGVISVGAVDEDNDLLPTSNYGEHLSVVAPGSNINCASGNGYYKTASGSSFSTPIVTSLVAQIKAKNKTLTPYQIKEIIEANCTDIGPPGKDIYFGAGIINFEKTLRSLDKI